jgi:hypothetical protein
MISCCGNYRYCAGLFIKQKNADAFYVVAGDCIVVPPRNDDTVA